MEVKILENSAQLGLAASEYASGIIRQAIAAKGKARIVLSTGASQFDFLEAFVRSNVDWSCVEMFHLDEYIGLPESHPASFRKYLKERFTGFVPLGGAFFVNGEGDVEAGIRTLSAEIRKQPIDLALIGIGENGHIAFNDPPADFQTKEAYSVVELDEACKKQQVGEGWFAEVSDVPNRAITMTVHQIMQSKVILSCVPHAVKANAIKQTVESDVTVQVPATMLKRHPHWILYLDKESAGLVDNSFLS